jgi:lipopolysaccharide biosynthesis protein
VTKILALYLPQFHQTVENDKWWGTGFTEWTNTKKAKKLFRSHYQPRTPLNHNYYDLSDPSVLEKQSKMAQQYGIYGFCYYHYWFNGVKMLQKPLEQMLENPGVTIPFCFSWANDTWTKTWDNNENEILLKQEYGVEENWQKHLDYLLPFFKDERYIRLANRPVFFIYRTSGFNRMNEMIIYWDQQLKQQGFDGIHIVETLNTFQQHPFCENSKAVFEFEPMFTLRNRINMRNKIIGKIKQIFKVEILYRYEYDYVWKNILKYVMDRSYKDKDVYRGAFVDWDNTARKGKNGMVIVNASPSKFSSYFSKLLKISNKHESEFLIINAWNEWAEGAYLEPDEKYRFDYLEAVSESVDKLK